MQFLGDPFSLIDWDNVPIEKQAGENGFYWHRTFKNGNVRIVMAEYSPGFRAVHWCCRGHLLHLLEGEMNFEQKDGSIIRMTKGMTCCFSDNNPVAHKAFTSAGASLMIID